LRFFSHGAARLAFAGEAQDAARNHARQPATSVDLIRLSRALGIVDARARRRLS